MVKSMALLAVLAFLGGCASPPPAVVDARQAAKIRVFHGTAVYMHPGQSCYGAKNPDTIHAAAGGFSMLEANKKVGMPTTEDLPWSYHEYVIPAGKPLTLEMYWATEGGGMSHRCGPVGATFMPEVGKYYDTSMLFAGGRCSVRLRELTEVEPGKAQAALKATTPSYPCPKG